MRKILVVGFILAGFVFMSAISHAAPVGNIAKPAMLKSEWLSKGDDKPTFGLIGEGEFDVAYDVDIEGALGDTEFESVGGKLGLVCFEKFILYGSLGTAVFEQEFDSGGRDVRLESDVGLAWGLGGTVIAYETTLEEFDNSILRIGLDGRFRFTDVDVESVREDTVTYDPAAGDINGEGLTYRDWQVAAAASMQWGNWTNFIPYIGAKYSHVETDATVEVGPRVHHLINAESENHVGVFVGTDIIIVDNFSVNVEGRFIDEEAFSFGAALRF